MIKIELYFEVFSPNGNLIERELSVPQDRIIYRLDTARSTSARVILDPIPAYLANYEEVHYLNDTDYLKEEIKFQLGCSEFELSRDGEGQLS
tara:strand:- start:271 stop:546 length:276 start_codon:yes stop_codon:yes gene_type:complete